MSPIKKFLYHSTAYTVVISMLFLAFAKIIGVNDLHLSFSRYFVIFAFGLICSASEFLFSVEKLPKFLRYFIQYLVLAIAFFVIFMTVRAGDGNYQFSAATIFASVAIFSLFYFLILAFVLIHNKKVLASKKKALDNPLQKEKYKSRFGK